MEHIRLLRTGIMAEYPVMSTLQGICGQIEQTLHVIRETYEMCRAGGVRGLELGTVYVAYCCNVASGILVCERISEALDGDCREGGMFAFSAIRLKLAFSKIILKG